MDIARYLTDSQTTPSLWWLYKFPNGKSASVIPDPDTDRPFRFEMEVDGDSYQTFPGLTTGEVEAKLTELANA